ncbi:MAG TPA: type II secretion system F family protein [Symbiobacteriaceae bacterium]|nr:type II secretion system F family protein [Symbiobacteriaceae bacterium]
MALIFVLMLVACTGAVYGAYLMKKEKERRVADLIYALEADGPGGETDSRDAGLIGKLRQLMPAAVMEAYEQKLIWAGRPFGLDAAQFVGAKAVLAVTLPLLLSLMTLFQPGAVAALLMVIAGLSGFIAPDVWLNGRVGARRQVVAEELPLFADLIATAISAGLPLTEAVRRVSADAPGLVAREFLRAVQEMAAGKPRAEAWRDLVTRVPGEDLRVIVNAIMQAEQYGTSVAEIIRYQIQQIRLFKQQEAQRIAQVTTVRMRIPMLLMILLPFMVLLLGPALLQIAKLLL